MPAYALTIFTGAFLLFQVQPLIGKYILPWFGGGPGVWTTCMLFFQVLLLAGYAYAHLTARFLKTRPQVIVHLVLLAAALALLPITPADSWKPPGGGNPTMQILVLLAATLGLPYFVLSSTGPLMQQWFTRTNPGVSPYRLYALSNAGSLLALISYPFYFESHFTRKMQAALWAWGLVVFVLCCGVCALKLWKAKPVEEFVRSDGESRPDGSAAVPSGGSLASPEAAGEFPIPPAGADAAAEAVPVRPLPTLGQRILWLLWPACASVLLLATTNKMCQDVAVVPFLWVLPLSLYLLSFVICFDNPRWYGRFPFTLAFVAASVGLCVALFKGTDLSLAKQVGIYAGGLFVCCMVCHGELYRLRPAPRHLTGFYLMIATGGALGGLLVAVVAPLVFSDYYELQAGFLLCGLLFTFVCARDRTPAKANLWLWLACVLSLAAFAGIDQSLAWLGAHYKTLPKGGVIGVRIGLAVVVLLGVVSWLARKRFRNAPHWRFVVCGWLSLGLVALGVALGLQARKSARDSVERVRNFYGVLTVIEYGKDSPKNRYFLLRHGRITHGFQFTAPDWSDWPTTYYGEKSGVGLAVRALPAGARRIGLVGLGTGTMTAYGRAGDYLRIYDINPAVQLLATSRFTYLAQCPATVEVVLGDARLSMEREPPQQFDLLALDAFSSDAIPVHLLTREAFEIYGRHLKTNGVLAVHTSNHYLDLEPVVVNLARQFNYQLAIIDYDENEKEWWVYSSTWILLTRSAEILKAPPIREAAIPAKTNWARVPIWTDDFTSLYQILK